MDSYQVEFAKGAEKDLRRLDTRYVPRIITVAENLALNPRPVGYKKLIGSNHTYRIRVGDYRVIYEIEDNKLIVLVVRIRHRQGQGKRIKTSESPIIKLYFVITSQQSQDVHDASTRSTPCKTRQPVTDLIAS